mmetsp:Transcript_32053/g.81671  ORF Transcript_32053/g.81671 Transcript_32053/m.81671 type:complete len:236 (+) Transcript_32053:243-950(+)
MVAERVGYAEVQDLRGAAASRPRPKAKGRRPLPVLPRPELGGPADGLHGLLRHRRRAVDFIHALVHRAAPRLPDPVCAQARAGQHPLRLVSHVPGRPAHAAAEDERARPRGREPHVPGQHPLLARRRPSAEEQSADSALHRTAVHSTLLVRPLVRALRTPPLSEVRREPLQVGLQLLLQGLEEWAEHTRVKPRSRWPVRHDTQSSGVMSLLSVWRLTLSRMHSRCVYNYAGLRCV